MVVLGTLLLNDNLSTLPQPLHVAGTGLHICFVLHLLWHHPDFFLAQNS